MGGMEVLVHALLDRGPIGVVEQIIVVLLGDPVHVRHREGVAAEPVGPLGLVLQAREGQLRAHAQITGDVGQQPVLQQILVGVPAHVGGQALGLVGGGDLGEAGHEDVGQGVHQTVAVLVGGAVGHLLVLRAAVADQRVQAHLGGGDQTRGLHQHHELHLGEEVTVGFVHLQIVHVGTGDDAHVQILGRLAQHADAPHGGQVRDGHQALRTPLLDILLRFMPAQDDEGLLVPEHGAVHGIENIGDQIIVEGVVEQNAPAAEQIPAGVEVVLVQNQALAHLAAHEFAVGLQHGIVAVLQVGQKLVVAPDPAGIGHDLGVLGGQLVAEEAAQGVAHVAEIRSVHQLGFHALELRLHLLPGQTAQEEADLTQHDHAEDGEEDPREPARAEEPQGHQRDDAGQNDGGDVGRLEEGAGLGIVLAQVPLLLFRLVVVEDPGDLFVQPAARLADPLEEDQQELLQDDVDQQEQDVLQIEEDVDDGHPAEQVVQGS